MFREKSRSRSLYETPSKPQISLELAPPEPPIKEGGERPFNVWKDTLSR